jgi:peptidoglycan/xylan/chitin deacetylase (PgdA/CDA1 family)
MKRAAALVLAILLLAPCGAAVAAPGKDRLSTREGVNGVVCLTFDDGFTDRARLVKTLGILRANHVKCTFFIIGNMLLRNTDLWRQAIKDGHEICYHTMTHKMAVLKNAASILQDIAQWNKTAKLTLGQNYTAPKFARLPGGFGQNDERIAGVYQKAGYQIIGWNVDTLTGAIAKKKPGETVTQLRRQIVRYVKNRTNKNSIILLHFDGGDINALPAYIGWLKGKYKLGTVSEALAPAQPAAAKPAPPPVVFPPSVDEYLHFLYPWMTSFPDFCP